MRINGFCQSYFSKYFISHSTEVDYPKAISELPMC